MYLIIVRAGNIGFNLIGLAVETTIHAGDIVTVFTDDATLPEAVAAFTGGE